MEMYPLLTEVYTREQLRSWLEHYHDTEKCCWIKVSMKPVENTVLYLDGVEEALCFGWIDGVKKSVPDEGVMQRLSPRARSSSWTELNKQRALRLERLGQMHEAGRKVYPLGGLDTFTIDEDIQQRLQEDPQTYANFLSFPELYRRIRIDNIQSYRKQPELFASRLDKFLEQTRANKMYGQWNDGGRLK
ncbi:YdeI family protein [Saccharibacillus sp. JS10]|uniref:YdeI/OmpD-associated family protein n=1 Tax=Saccharibacillus sp. JS10 TaxID=2950552 RepID=UPI00210F2014|nr:YdeI/OmpD-associated family protein [Saccharibacillus sp. JS10]MCQ4085282.1 YdeI/OmpD-associated family protein [Saccharibacillus sp. JS10]